MSFDLWVTVIATFIGLGLWGLAIFAVYRLLPRDEPARTAPAPEQLDGPAEEERAA